MPRSLANYSRGELFRFVTAAFAVVWAPQVYGAVANHPVMAWLYVPLLILCRFSVALYSLAYMVALILGDLFVPGPRLPQFGLALQAVIILWHCRRGDLLRPVQPQSKFAAPHRAAQRASKPLLAIIAIGLVAGAICFRAVPPIEASLWAVCVAATAWAVTPTVPANWRTAVATALLTLFSTTFAAALLETGARILLPPAAGPSDMYMPEPKYIFTLRPNSKGDFHLKDNNREWQSVEAVISSQGVRNAELGPKAADEFRIVMIGDSYTMGHGLEPEKNISAVLEKQLREAHLQKRITVVNCGVGGYAPWQERGFLRARGFAFEPDLVVLQVFPGNDVAGSLSPVQKYVKAPDLEWEKRLNFFRRQGEPALKVERWVQRHSRVYIAVARLLGADNPVAQILSDCRWWPKLEVPHVVQREIRNPYREASLITSYPELDEAYQRLETDIQGIQADCRARGVDLVAYCHPFPMGILDDSWGEEDIKTRDVTFELDKDVRLTNAIFDRAGIPHADVTGALESYPHPEALYFKYDGHWTPEGAQVVARSLADFLLQQYFATKLAPPAARQ